MDGAGVKGQPDGAAVAEEAPYDCRNGDLKWQPTLHAAHLHWLGSAS